jgi:hypothetical protein
VTPELRHCPVVPKHRDEGGFGQSLRRLTLQRQAALLHRQAGRIDAALARAEMGLGLPSDWEETYIEGQKLLDHERNV